METRFNEQIGELLGELIVANYLPTLSTDSLRTRVLIQVSDELTKEWERKKSFWERTVMWKNGNVISDLDIFNDNLQWYNENIKHKYLSDMIEIPYNFFFTEKHTVLEYINYSLFDSDLSHYTATDIITKKYVNIIILTRD